MAWRKFFCVVLVTMGVGFGGGSTVLAAVIITGSTWDDQGDSLVFVGYTGNGTLTVNGGTWLSRGSGYIGYAAGFTGTALVTGSGSKWSSSSRLYVGLYGDGKLTVTSGGLVTAAVLYASPGNLLGDGTVTATQGAVLDADLVFDDTQGATQARSFGTGGTLNLTFDPNATLGAGYRGTGTLRIAAGAKVTSRDSYLGLESGSTGTATVAGIGSTWTTKNGDLTVGNNGNGALNVQEGGHVEVSYAYSHVGRYSGSTGWVTVTGNGSTWTSNYALYVGESGSGTLNIQAGGQMQGSGYLGYNPGSIGTATVAGADSLWNCSGVTVGRSGSGTLNIQAGGQVSSSSGTIAYQSGSTGTALVTGGGSTWNSAYLSVGSGGAGTLSVQDGGHLSTSDNASIGLYAASTGTVTVDGQGSAWTGQGFLLVGSHGRGTLSIRGGGQVHVPHRYVYVGAEAGSVGTVDVTGAGSTLTNSDTFIVGVLGNGTLSIQAGGKVVGESDASIANGAGSTGAATVTGAGSTWTNAGSLYVGCYGGNGKLNVADRGKVAAKNVKVGTQGQGAVRLDVSGNDMLVLGTTATIGSVTNDGTVSFYADAFLPVLAYTPISESGGRTMAWSGTGSYKAFGGTWDTSAKTFTPAALTALAAGSPHTVGTGERLVFSDPGSGKHVGTSFGSVAGGTTFSASIMSQSELDALKAMAGFEGLVLSAWVFDTNFSGGEALVSFDVGLGAEDLAVWRYAGGAWTPYAADWLTYDANGIVDFTVTGFSGYAVSAVPEPATLALVGLGGLAMLRRPLRRQRNNNGRA